jgi:PIN domain nuclease of toxin-antitoxin system
MKYLLDTHVLAWSFTNTSKISDRVKEILSKETSLYVSTVSLWEISIKFNLGKLELNGLTPEEFFVVAEKWGFNFIPFSNREAITFYKLERLHKDPFDRMLIWQSITNGMTLLSKDNRMEAYEKLGLNLIW